VDGAGTVDLSEEDGKTLLKYSGDAQIGGMLASVGQRLIEGASKQMINQSVKALVEQITQRANGGPAEPVATASAASAAAPAATPEPAPAPAPPEAEPAPSAAPPPPFAASEPPSFERRTVVVPAHQQLKPEAIARGIVDDMLRERPWLPWVVIAFLFGVLMGRSRRR
jgi:hypothetical protein